jgi:hypothetical protein
MILLFRHKKFVVFYFKGDKSTVINTLSSVTILNLHL